MSLSSVKRDLHEPLLVPYEWKFTALAFQHAAVV
jgi:hypothetical protein